MHARARGCTSLFQLKCKEIEHGVSDGHDRSWIWLRSEVQNAGVVSHRLQVLSAKVAMLHQRQRWMDQIKRL